MLDFFLNPANNCVLKREVCREVLDKVSHVSSGKGGR